MTTTSIGAAFFLMVIAIGLGWLIAAIQSDVRDHREMRAWLKEQRRAAGEKKPMTEEQMDRLQQIVRIAGMRRWPIESIYRADTERSDYEVDDDGNLHKTGEQKSGNA